MVRLLLWLKKLKESSRRNWPASSTPVFFQSSLAEDNRGGHWSERVFAAFVGRSISGAIVRVSVRMENHAELNPLRRTNLPRGLLILLRVLAVLMGARLGPAAEFFALSLTRDAYFRTVFGLSSVRTQRKHDGYKGKPRWHLGCLASHRMPQHNVSAKQESLS